MQPTLIQGGTVLSTGDDFTSNGPLIAAIAYVLLSLLSTPRPPLTNIMISSYLQTGTFPPTSKRSTPAIRLITFLPLIRRRPQHPGGCGFNGEGCTLIETTLVNPTSPGSGSSTDISLIPPHSFSVTSGFGSVSTFRLILDRAR